MSSVVDRVRAALTRAEPGPVDAGALVSRVDALRRFLRAVEDHLPETELVAARTVVDRAGERLELSREHTVVALAGATGSGKSSIFNALAGRSLSQVGVRRPTTGVAHACAWGTDGAGPLLDWLGVPPNRRFDPETARRPAAGDPDDAAADPAGADGAAGLHGLVLLDLPDFDSVAEAHRGEVDRLLRLVDLVVWVLDPQKYADGVIHERYLRRSVKHRDITLVCLNQADQLSPADTERCLADLRRLLDADGLTGIPLLATSTVVPGGLDGLRTALEHGVTAHEAYLWRLAGDLADAVEELAPTVAVEAPEDSVDRAAVRHLVDTLATVAGVPAVIEAVEQAYRYRAAGSTGWPIGRWARRLRPDPLRRLHLDRDDRPARRPAIAAFIEGDGAGNDRDESPDSPAADPVAVPSLPEATAAQRAAAALAARALAESSAQRLPHPWPAAAMAAARARQQDVPDAMEVAIARTDLAVSRRPAWWRVVGFLQWFAALVALLSLGWLAVRLAFAVFGLPELPGPRVGLVPLATVLLFGALLFGVLLAVVVRPLVRLGARRARRIAERRLRSAIAEVASDLVVAPVRVVLRAYSDARAALAKAR